MADILSTQADGMVAVRVATSIADTSAPTVAEWSGATDISMYLTSDGLTPSLSEQTISDERLGTTATYEQPGRFQRSLDLIYIDNTNTANPNAAKTALAPLAQRYLLIRRGVAKDTAGAAAQLVSVWPGKPGQYSQLPPEANSVLKIAQKFFVNGAVTVDVALTGSAPVPTVSAATPSAAGDYQIVVITGAYFTGTTALTFGGVAAADFEVVSDSTIHAVMPSGDAGSAAIIVTNGAGASSSFAYTRGA